MRLTIPFIDIQTCLPANDGIHRAPVNDLINSLPAAPAISPYSRIQ